jgi:predicted peptidase
MRILIGLAVLLFAACGGPRLSEKEFPSRSGDLDGKRYNYRLYVPADRNPAEKIPVMLYLHGSNRRGKDNRSQLEDLADVIKEYPPPFIMVFPQCPEGTFWAGPAMQQALAALEQTVKEFNGDENRLYLAGFSMGGFGAWQAAVTYPNKFAAVVPVAGGILPLGQPSEEDKAQLSPAVRTAIEQPDIYKAYAAAIGNTPVWVFHGEKDEAVPVEGARKMVETLKAAGNPNVKYTEFENVGHGSVIKAFTEPGLYAWLAEQRKNIPR